MIRSSRDVCEAPGNALSDVRAALGPNTVRLSFREAAVEGVGTLRFTGIDSPNVEIFSMLLFPNDSTVLPVFASEFVFFGGVTRAAVVDLQLGSANGPHGDALRRLALTFPELMADDLLPEWCVPHFTPEAVFILRETSIPRERLDDAFTAYLSAYLGCLPVVRIDAPAEDDALLAEYKAHHRRHTPGRRFLTRCFGGAWTEQFLAEAMYAPQTAMSRSRVETAG